MTWSPPEPAASDSLSWADLSQNLRFELGWTEVRSGLGLILRGWLQIIVSVAIGVGGLFAIFAENEKGKPQMSAVARELYVDILLAVVGLAMLYSWGCILWGYWRCLMHAPERYWAKWLMFGCLLCICAGPVINVVVGASSIPRQVKFQRGLEDLSKIELPRSAMVMQLAAAGVDQLNFLLFILFLRAVARCFNDSVQVQLTNLFLVLYGLTLGSTICFLLIKMPLVMRGMFLILLICGGGACFVYYLVLVALARAGITRGLSGTQPVRAP